MGIRGHMHGDEVAVSDENDGNAKAADGTALSRFAPATVGKDDSPKGFAIDEISLASHRRAIAYGRARGDA